MLYAFKITKEFFGVGHYIDNLNYLLLSFISSYEFNEISYNSNDMVWRSLPGTVIPDYEESTNLVLLRNQEFFISGI